LLESQSHCDEAGTNQAVEPIWAAAEQSLGSSGNTNHPLQSNIQAQV
jgi:hypothetical protein